MHNIKSLCHQSSFLNKLNPISFTGKDSEKTHYGFIPQEVCEIAPNLVIRDGRGIPCAIKSNEFTPLLVSEMKQLRLRVEQLEERLGKKEENCICSMMY